MPIKRHLYDYLRDMGYKPLEALRYATDISERFTDGLPRSCFSWSPEAPAFNGLRLLREIRL